MEDGGPETVARRDQLEDITNHLRQVETLLANLETTTDHARTE